MGTDRLWWVSRTSNPLSGGKTARGRFDSYTLPPYFAYARFNDWGRPRSFLLGGKTLSKNVKENVLRNIPPINDILDETAVAELIGLHGRKLVLLRLGEVLDDLKNKLKNKTGKAEDMNCASESQKDLREKIIFDLSEAFKRQDLGRLKSVINATGIVLHTNLGRAPLPKNSLEKVFEICSGYSNLEYDLNKGIRGSRYDHLEEKLCRLTGAESAIIVNNNAAAVFLCLNTFAFGREVLVSRGELVEIGGHFRIPEIIINSGCMIREVGTTNKTYNWDYERAINENTAVLLKVHTSNYRITGFVCSAEIKEIEIPQGKVKPIMMEDLGSGCLFDLSSLGISKERSPGDSLESGADLVTFSGDKLLGGPQAGIIIGKKELIEKIKKNPLLRIVRCDKMTIAALEGLLETYDHADSPEMKIPALSMLAEDSDSLTAKALSLAKKIKKEAGAFCKVDVIDVEEVAGGGSLPGVVFRGKAVAVRTLKENPERIRKLLRKSEQPIVCRIAEDRILFHVRTITEKEIEIIGRELRKVLEQKS